MTGGGEQEPKDPTKSFCEGPGRRSWHGLGRTGRDRALGVCPDRDGRACVRRYAGVWVRCADVGETKSSKSAVDATLNTECMRACVRACACVCTRVCVQASVWCVSQRASKRVLVMKSFDFKCQRSNASGQLAVVNSIASGRGQNASACRQLVV